MGRIILLPKRRHHRGSIEHRDTVLPKALWGHKPPEPIFLHAVPTPSWLHPHGSHTRHLILHLYLKVQINWDFWCTPRAMAPPCRPPVSWGASKPWVLWSRKNWLKKSEPSVGLGSGLAHPFCRLFCEWLGNTTKPLFLGQKSAGTGCPSGPTF